MAGTDSRGVETAATCRSAHADHGNANCTGVCQRPHGHSGKHKDQHGHEY
jgi:hypothetical protein